MLAILIITSMAIVGYTQQVVECPSETQQVGATGAAGMYQSGPSQDSLPIDGCKNYCKSMGERCGAFAFDPTGFNTGVSRCIPYRDQRTPGTYGAGHPSSDQLLCSMDPGCPSETHQVGAIGAAGMYQSGPSQESLPIDGCKNYCKSMGPNCGAFAFDPTGLNTGVSRCIPYRDQGTPGTYGAGHPSSDQLLCSMSLECPSETQQVGATGAAGMYQSGPSKYSLAIDGCKNYCKSMGQQCGAFAFDPTGMNTGVSRCNPYRDQRTPGTYGAGHPSSDQLLCSMGSVCPAGTTLIAQGEYFYAGSFYYQPGIPIEHCASLCVNQFEQCTAIEFDTEAGPEGSSSLCRLFYGVNSGTRRGDAARIPGGYRADQVLCGVTGKFSAESPGLFNLDGVSVVDGNGEVTQISVYIIYIVVGLVLVNIICLMVNCWKKVKRNKKQYKVVSMRSDDETDIECK